MVGRALVVFVFDLCGVLDFVDEDPAPLVDPVNPEVVALLGQPALLRKGSGERYGRPEDDGRTGCGGIRATAAAAGSQRNSQPSQKRSEPRPSHPDNVAHHRMPGCRRGGAGCRECTRTGRSNSATPVPAWL